jgi:hypothetical protein
MVFCCSFSDCFAFCVDRVSIQPPWQQRSSQDFEPECIANHTDYYVFLLYKHLALELLCIEAQCDLVEGAIGIHVHHFGICVVDKQGPLKKNVWRFLVRSPKN